MGSDACLGWYNHKQSCENENLCSGAASLGLPARTGLALGITRMGTSLCPGQHWPCIPLKDIPGTGQS